jgi:hypothetical protein
MFIVLEINKYIVQKCMYTVQKCMYTVQKCIYSVYKVHIYCTGPYVKWYSHTSEVVSPLTSSKYIVLNGNFVFDLRDLFHEHNPGIK